MKVLIAEDSLVTRSVLEKHVSEWGFDTVVVEDGKQALEILQRDDAPQLAILDWQMPEMDGIDVCRNIKGNVDLPFTYVVILTSRDEQDDIITGLDAGADEYLTKPVKPAILRSRLYAARRIIEAVPPKEWNVPRIDGYDVKRILGKGAFATVWEAVNLATGQPQALKIIRIDLALKEVYGRFAQEIQLMQKMDHPHIAKVYDSHLDDKLGYCAMELIDGWTLDKYVKQEKPTPARFLFVVSQVCEALEHAHQQGIVHRDLKPSNIMVTRDKVPKLVDFGLGMSMFRLDAESETDASFNESVVGTPLTMSPEQARGDNERIDGRTDIYALGVVLYMTFVRRHPSDIADKNTHDKLKEISEGSIRPPSTFAPNIDPNLEQIILKALAKEPNDRYQSAAEFGAELRRYLEDRARKKKQQSDD